MKNYSQPLSPERWDLLDENRIPVGKTLRRGEKIPSGICHIVVMGWIVNRKGEFLISRRSPEKTSPLLWETTGGAKQAGEDSLKAIIREIREEVGIDVSKNRPVFLGSRQRLERIFFDCWMFFKDFPAESVTLQQGETCDARWVDDDTFLQMMQKGQVTRASTEFFPLMKGWRDLLIQNEDFPSLSGE